MSSDLFGFDNSFRYETSASPTHQDQLFFESSWEEIASLLESSSPAMEVKKDESQLTFSCYGNSVSPAPEFMHTNYGQYTQSFPFGPQFHHVFESNNSENQLLGSPQSICSNGDLQKAKVVAHPFCSEKSLMGGKVGRYSKEERKWRIDRYRAKRSRRNFNKTIKYACRKTLADGRQRIRGRFVRRDDVGEILEASLFHICENKYHLWNIDDWLISRRGSS